MNKIVKIKMTQDLEKELGTSSWGTWEKEPSTFPWEYDDKETCHILEGEATVTTDDGDKVHFTEGDLVTFPKGLKCTWKIEKKIRKYYKFGE